MPVSAFGNIDFWRQLHVSLGMIRVNQLFVRVAKHLAIREPSECECLKLLEICGNTVCLILDGYDTPVTVYRDHLTTLDPLGCVANTQNCRYAVLAGDDRTVRENTTDVGYESAAMWKELCPCGCRERANQDGVGDHLVEVVWCHDDTGDAGNGTW